MQVEKEITTFGRRLVRTLTAGGKPQNEPASVSELALRSFCSNVGSPPSLLPVDQN